MAKTWHEYPKCPKCGHQMYFPPAPCSWCGYAKRQLTDAEKKTLAARLEKARAAKKGKS